MKNNIIASESFSSDYKRTFFFDFRQAVNDRHYITMSCSRRQEDESYERATLTFFENEFEFLLEAMGSLFAQAKHQAELRGKPAGPAGGVNGIKSWEAEDRPREKLLAAGRTELTDAELLAMLICSGRPGLTAVALAAQVLGSVGGDLQQLAILPVEALMAFDGIGVAKALSIISAMELAERLAKARLGKGLLRALKTGDKLVKVG